MNLLKSVNVGNWRNYQSYTNKEQISLQRNNLIFTGLESGLGEVTFIYTRYMEELLEKINEMNQEIRIEDIETIIEDEVYYTSKIEGAKTTRVRTSQIHNGAQIDKNNEYSEKMIKNGFEAVKLMNLIGSKEVTHDVLIKVWSILVKDVCENEEIRGNYYRIGDVEVGTHNTPEHFKVYELMNNWISFYNNDKYDEYPFLKTILLHYAFETIHPFCDGNGRMGRLLINNYLISRGIESARAVSFSMQIDKRRSHYDTAFVDSENLYNDCTPFIEYMLEIMYSAFETSLEVQKNNNELDTR